MERELKDMEVRYNHHIILSLFILMKDEMKACLNIYHSDYSLDNLVHDYMAKVSV